MELVLAHALPPAEMAASLGQALAGRHPELIDWFKSRQSKQSTWSVATHGCTAIEGLRLQSLGFEAQDTTPLGAGLAPLLAGIEDGDEPIWLAALCSTQIRQEGATLIAQDFLDITDEQRAALTEAAMPYFEAAGDGIRIQTLANGQWRVWGPWPTDSHILTPNALLARDLGDWWPTQSHWRDWRKRVNELQMVWHEHPVNAQRQAQGLLPINTVWLHGGAPGFKPVPQQQQVWLDDLEAAGMRQDWASWLDGWQPLVARLCQTPQDQVVRLVGEDRIVQLEPSRPSWWQRLTGRHSKQDWSQWWNNPS